MRDWFQCALMLVAVSESTTCNNVYLFSSELDFSQNDETKALHTF